MNITPTGFVRSLRVSALAAAGLALAAFAPALNAKTHLKISANAAAMDAFSNWTAGNPWDGIKNFKNGNATRPVVDLVLELQALKAGGLDFDFEFVRELTYDQAKQDVIDGRADLTAETVWDSEIAATGGALLNTEPVIAKGEFVKGIYVLPANEKLLKLASADGLHGTSAAVTSTWALDVKTLETLSLKEVRKAATPELAYAAVQRGQAEFVLDEFSSQPDMRVERGGVKLIPIPGYKVGLVDSRSWVVSKRSADAQAVLKALQAGQKILRENGTIQRAYTECGFFNPKVADWKPLM